MFYSMLIWYKITLSNSGNPDTATNPSSLTVKLFIDVFTSLIVSTWKLYKNCSSVISHKNILPSSEPEIKNFLSLNLLSKTQLSKIYLELECPVYLINSSSFIILVIWIWLLREEIKIWLESGRNFAEPLNFY